MLMGPGSLTGLGPPVFRDDRRPAGSASTVQALPWSRHPGMAAAELGRPPSRGGRR